MLARGLITLLMGMTCVAAGYASNEDDLSRRNATPGGDINDMDRRWQELVTEDNRQLQELRDEFRQQGEFLNQNEDLISSLEQQVRANGDRIYEIKHPFLSKICKIGNWLCNLCTSTD